MVGYWVFFISLDITNGLKSFILQRRISVTADILSWTFNTQELIYEVFTTARSMSQYSMVFIVMTAAEETPGNVDILYFAFHCTGNSLEVEGAVCQLNNQGV